MSNLLDFVHYTYLCLFQSFKERVAAFLVKDPKKNPTSEKLMKHNFFNHAKTHDWLCGSHHSWWSSYFGEKVLDVEGHFLVQNLISFFFWSFKTLTTDCHSCNKRLIHTTLNWPGKDLLDQNKALYGDKEHLSQVIYSTSFIPNIKIH